MKPIPSLAMGAHYKRTHLMEARYDDTLLVVDQIFFVLK